MRPKMAPSRAVESSRVSGLEGREKSERIRPTKSPSHTPESSPPTATRPHVRRAVTRSICLRSVPTMRQFSTGNWLSESVSTAFCASTYCSNTPSDMGYSRESVANPWRPPGPFGCRLMRPSSHPRRGGEGPSSLELVVLDEAAADDHPLDVGRALADEQHRRLAVEALDLVLLGVAVAAVDAEAVLDDLRAVLGRKVLRHAGLEVVALAGVLLAGGLDHHLVRGLDLDGHVGEAEEHGLVVDDLLAEGLALLGVGDAELESPSRDTTSAGSDVDTADLDAVHHLVEALARLASEDLRVGRAVPVEDELGRVDALVAHLVDLAGHRDALGGLAEALGLVAEEGGHVLVDRVRAGVGLDQHGDEVRLPAVGQPHLLAVDGPVVAVAVAHGLGLDRRDVGTAARL